MQATPCGSCGKEDSDSVGPSWGLGLCISTMVPSDASVAGPRATLGVADLSQASASLEGLLRHSWLTSPSGLLIPQVGG